MDESHTDDHVAAEWANDSFEDAARRKGAERVIEWAREHALMESIVGDSFSVAFPHLPRSAGWLTVSTLESSAIVRLDRLKGYPPFLGETRSRLLKKLRRGGDFLHEEAGHAYAKVDLASLSDEYEWKLLEARLNLVADIASTTGGVPSSEPTT